MALESPQERQDREPLEGQAFFLYGNQEQGKKEKQAKLYEFVTSTRCMNLFARFSDEVEHLHELDEKEKTQQEKMRNDRAKHVGEIKKTVLGELKREIHDVLGL